MTPRKKPLPGIWETHARKIMLIGGVLVALGTIWTFSGPVRDSGPLPLPSRNEVIQLRDQSEQRFKTVDEGLKQTLDTALAALTAADDAKRQSNENRMRRLLEQQKNFQMRLDAAPGDRLFQELLDANKIEIQKMLDEAKLAK